MSYLLYCIVRADHEEHAREPGVCGYPRASIMARAAGLGAVLSESSRSDLAPDVARLLAYASVIESFNRARSVIPMRFGCKFANLAEVEGLLRRECRRYHDLLHEFDGRIEMSVHFAVKANAIAARDGLRPVPDGPGTSYLETRRRYYALKEQEVRWAEEIAARICRSAQGRFARHTAPAAEGALRQSASIHFLVPREGIADFADSLHASGAADELSLRITGPWPPYNFVSSIC